MGGRHADGRYPWVQRGLLVHQRRTAPHRAAEADREIYTHRLRLDEVRSHSRRPWGVYTTVVRFVDTAMGRRRGATSAFVSGESAVTAVTYQFKGSGFIV